MTLQGGSLVAGAAVGTMIYAVRGRTSSLLAPSVSHGARDRRSLAFTFDDGPTPQTGALLELLAKHNIKATFFQCGVQARRLPSMVREVVQAGHEIGNHTDTHPMLAFRSPGFIEAELSRAQQSIAEAAGTEPKLFRAPYGVRWFGLRQAQAKLGLQGVMWTVIGRDWRLSGSMVAARLVRGAERGAIFCLHDGRGIEASPDIRSTLEAMCLAVPKLIDLGFRFEKVSDLLCPKN